MKVVAIVQARMGSKRLPGKVLKPVCDTPMIELLLSRLACAEQLDQIVIATSVDQMNKPLIEHVVKLGFDCFQGSEHDVLERYVQAAQRYRADVVVRITGDCPLVDPNLVDQCVIRFKAQHLDYLCNNHPPSYPDGLDIEVCSIGALLSANEETDDPYDREHVTPYLQNSERFKICCLKSDVDLSSLRWTVDELEDFIVIERVFEHFHPDRTFSWKDVLNLQQTKPQLFATNMRITRNEGAKMGSGQKLWKRAKQVIPGGSMLLSKRAEMFLPSHWPTYFDRAKGCHVWDLDGKQYVDMCYMGIGTNVLGYGHPEVDAAVMQTVAKGNMSTLNCPEEVQLAEKLVELHPWAEMVRLARTGGEANAIAIRIARASSGKDKVAICGYHGWHDWYLAANLGDSKTLDGHLLPGLHPMGVPRELKGSILPFKYNNLDELEQLVCNHDIGTIIMEVARNHEPDHDFLRNVREIAFNRGIVLVFDECTSGFRETFGGLHKKYGVEPDLAIFGKALGNGYAITAIIGKRSVMDVAQSTFISSTFWTERIGPSAALAVLKVMERTRAWEQITQTGLNVRTGWQELADKHALQINHWGIPALAGFSFSGTNSLPYKTLISKEMLKYGYLASNAFYSCIDHSPTMLGRYFEVLDPVFKLISECEQGRDVMKLLDGEVCHSGFQRLN